MIHDDIYASYSISIIYMKFSDISPLVFEVVTETNEP
jgi:hypothetical protein